MANSFARTLASVVAGIYTIVATHLLAYLLMFAAVGLLFFATAFSVAQLFGYAGAEARWAAASSSIGVSSLALRLTTAVIFHAVLYRGLRRPFRWLREKASGVFDCIESSLLGIEREPGSPGGLARRAGPFRITAHALFIVVVTVLIIPFLIQPTLVSRASPAPQRWSTRAANLLDGTATVELRDSVPGYYRRWFQEPWALGITNKEDLERSIRESEDPDESSPVIDPSAPPTVGGSTMDRWDPHIRDAIKDRPELFAVVKAFMFVESGGRQFCVSRTGCAGLMQFCTGTARNARYRDIFGRGSVYRCACSGGRCKVARKIQRELETGDFSSVEGDPSSFPCELTDSRFVPERALRAGTKFIAGLYDSFGGNIYLMYIGYNSGPGVAKKVWAGVGQKSGVSLEEIEVHLAKALQASFGSSSSARAGSLVRTHLPKLAAARDRYAEAQKN